MTALLSWMNARAMAGLTPHAVSTLLGQEPQGFLEEGGELAGLGIMLGGQGGTKGMGTLLRLRVGPTNVEAIGVFGHRAAGRESARWAA